MIKRFSAVDPRLQPPQKWQEEKTKEIKSTNPGYSLEQINTAVTKLWTELPESDKSKARSGQPSVSAKKSYLMEAIKIITAAEEENIIYGVDEKNNIVYLKEFTGGKFSDNVVQYLYKLAVVDQKGDSLGDMNFGMYYKLKFDPPLRVAEDENNIWQEPAAILRESKNGVIECEYYTSEETADRAWDEIERRYEKFLEELGI
jgi:hypothetical protein